MRIQETPFSAMYPVARTASPAQAPSTATSQGQADTVSLSARARALAEGSRVERLREALAAGTLTVDPHLIAQRFVQGG